MNASGSEPARTSPDRPAGDKAPDGEDLNLEFLSLFGVGMLAEKV